MKARVSKDSRYTMVTSCAGVVFNQQAWTEVPPGREEEAIANPYLEIQEPEKQDTPVSGTVLIGESTVDSVVGFGIPEAINISISPHARRYANELGLTAADLAEVKGSGANGLILKSDLEALGG